MSSILLFLVATALPPRPAHYVTDNAGVLGEARAHALDQKLAQFERDTSDQVLVYVDRDLPAGTTIEEMGAEAIHKWGVGQKGKDNGAILFVFTDAKKMRIEVGYGLESTLTDAKAKRITSTVMVPLMKSGDLAGGVEAGADAMLSVIRGADFTGTGKTRIQTAVTKIPCGLFMGLGVVIVVLLIVVIQRRSRRLGRPSSGRGRGWVPSDSYSSSSSGSSWSSSSDSSSSGSDSSFSGGGGDGGGGGSSDSW